MTMAIVFTSSNPVFLENIFLPQVSLRIDWTPKNPFLNLNRNWENSFFSIALSGSIFQKFGKKASSGNPAKPFAGSGYKLIDRRCLTKKIHEIADIGSKKSCSKGIFWGFDLYPAFYI